VIQASKSKKVQDPNGALPVEVGVEDLERVLPQVLLDF
jgi:hypothetical protein